MPFKHNAARRHRIPKQRWRVTNWPAYEAGLRRRGDLTFWLDEAALAGWQAPRRSTPGGQPRYSALAIELVLTLRLVFHLALGQAEGFSRSVLRLLGFELAIPDHTTLSRRGRAFAGRQPRVARHDGPVHLVLDTTGLQLFGQGEWDAPKHGRARRQWRKLHLAVDAGSSEIAAHVLTAGNCDDAGQAPDLLRQVEGTIGSLTADGAYDSDAVYRAASACRNGLPPDVVVPPRSSAVASTEDPAAQTSRDRHIQPVAEKSRMAWQRITGYGRRNLVETAIGRYQHLIGPKLRARTLIAQQGEAALAVAVLNRMNRVAKPVSVRRA
ncbi:MAG: IS5 family transposase [Janthinobacterium lividum]